jgi:hypothetical protein
MYFAIVSGYFQLSVKTLKAKMQYFHTFRIVEVRSNILNYLSVSAGETAVKPFDVEV